MEAPHDTPSPAGQGTGPEAARLEQPRSLGDLGDWAKLAADYGFTLLSLFKEELKVTLSGLPRLVVLAVLLLPFALFAWLGLCVLLSWAVYIASGSPAGGFALFFLLQVLVCAFLLWKMAAIRRTLFFPATRRQLALSTELLAAQEKEAPSPETRP